MGVALVLGGRVVDGIGRFVTSVITAVVASIRLPLRDTVLHGLVSHSGIFLLSCETVLSSSWLPALSSSSTIIKYRGSSSILFKPELAVALWTTGVVVGWALMVAVLTLGGSGGSPSEVVAMVGVFRRGSSITSKNT